MQPLFWPEISIKGKLMNKFCLAIDYCDINGIWVPQEVTQVHWTRRMRITTIARLPTMVGPWRAGDSFIVSVLYLPTFIYQYAQILCKDLRFRNYKRKYDTGTVDLFPHRSLWFSLELVYRSSVNHSSQSYLNIAILAPKSSSVEPAEPQGLLFYKFVRLMEIGIAIMQIIQLWYHCERAFGGVHYYIFSRLKPYLKLDFSV